MPAFAFAYGSFGDLLATVQLVISIVSFLQRSGKPSTQCAETLQELKTLGSDLSRLTTLPALDSTSPVVYTASRIQAEVRQCNKILSRFMAKISASGLLQKLLWAISEEKELASFRMQLIDRRVLLGLVVGLMNSGALEAVRDRVNEVSVQLAGLGINLHAGVDDLSHQIKLYQEQIVAVVRHIPRGTSDETFVVTIVSNAIKTDVPIPLIFWEKSEDLWWILQAYMHKKNDVPVFGSGMRSYVIVFESEIPFTTYKSLKAGKRIKLVEIVPLLARVKCPRCLFVKVASYKHENGLRVCANCLFYPLASYMELQVTKESVAHLLSLTPEMRKEICISGAPLITATPYQFTFKPSPSAFASRRWPTPDSTFKDVAHNPIQSKLHRPTPRWDETHAGDSVWRRPALIAECIDRCRNHSSFHRSFFHRSDGQCYLSEEADCDSDVDSDEEYHSDKEFHSGHDLTREGPGEGVDEGEEADPGENLDGGP